MDNAGDRVQLENTILGMLEMLMGERIDQAESAIEELARSGQGVERLRDISSKARNLRVDAREHRRLGRATTAGRQLTKTLELVIECDKRIGDESAAAKHAAWKFKLSIQIAVATVIATILAAIIGGIPAAIIKYFGG